MRNQIREDFFTVGGAKLYNGMASFLIRVGLVRFLDPAAYGTLIFGLNCLMLFDALVGYALDVGTVALLTRGERCEGARIRPVEKAAIRLKLALGAALAVLFAFAGEWLGGRFLHAPGGREFFLILAAGGVSILLVRSAQVYFQARLRFRVFAAIDLAHSSLRILLVAAVVFAGRPSAVAVLGCYAAAAALVVAAFFAYGAAPAAWRSVRPGWSDGRTLVSVSAPILASVGAGAIVSRMDMFLLALRTDPVQLGLYGAALTLAMIPEIVGAYLAPVFLPRILPALEAGGFRALFRRFHLAVYAVVGALAVLAFAAGQPLLALFLPAKYHASIVMTLIMVPGMLAAASYFPLTLNFLLMTRPRAALTIDVVGAPLLAAAFWFLAPAYGALGAAWITCLHRLLKAGAMQGCALYLSRRPGAVHAAAPMAAPL